MARVANYEQKIENITAKIEKKAEEIKALKAQLADLKICSGFLGFKVC